MKIGIIYSTSKKSTKKACKILASKINTDVQLIPIEKAKTTCILKYNFIIFIASAYNGKFQSSLKRYIIRNIKTIKEKPIALVINSEENINTEDIFNKIFTEELVNSSCINSNFGYELNINEGNFFEKIKTKNKIKNKENLPSLNIDEINKFSDYINNLIEKRVD
ncbi:MAG: flavodoxin domain-containing protein [archaeon]|uniref:Menaquinone-dependent protoporphyrinogen oxidase n=1 Tax=Methanobrevibacter gottschalkii DSM 11977 TaxID=1122229 RepID=A0A3N5C0D9_9EURY|nr:MULTISPECIES: flavodoxin domain-containing protein [Methanobrevibacter]MCQ2971223.1 flavodoxin domain-containing protein [archaeon]OEC93743.1 flavodoxin [Methanobrevibacter sp. A27]RPF52852.1 menaquinone-dependent protoporphyrinogen oxidase [Methanobrevibacter gottschalkii DSM 11977]